VVIILSRNPIPLWLNFLRNCLDALVLFVIFSIQCDSCVVLEIKFHVPLSLI